MFGNLAESFRDHVYEDFDNETCRRCYQEVRSSKRTLSRPQPFPYVGSNFYDSEKRLMFIGIESYSNQNRKSIEDLEPNIFETEQVERLYFGKKESGIKYSPFWQWVRVISTEILAPKNLDKDNKLKYAFTRIAYSNLHKCQNRKENSSPNKSTYQLLKTLSWNCIKDARWIYREIDAIKPKHIIVFAGSKRLGTRDFFLARLFSKHEEKKIKTYKYANQSRKKKRKGKDFILKKKDDEKKFIVTNHPQGTPTEIRTEIIRIIKENNWEDAEKL